MKNTFKNHVCFCVEAEKREFERLKKKFDGAENKEQKDGNDN